MAGDFGITFGAGLAVKIVTTIGQQARYCYQSNKFVKDMGDELETLKLTSDDIQGQLDEEENTDLQQSLQWKVENAIKLMEDVKELQRKAEARQSCCNGACPNLICWYINGKKAGEKRKAMEKLNQELEQQLTRGHRLPLQPMPPSKDFIPFQCTTKARDEILKALRDDKSKKIGLHGMGGCGKSSLLKAVHWEMEVSKLFDKIAFVVVSNPPDELDIQQGIANWIGLKFKMADKSLGDRAARLSMALKKRKKYLIILDNVWQVLQLESIGIPDGENCKVLLSSRKRQIFDYMKFDVEVYLSLLTKDEAWELFQKHAGDIKEPFLRVAQEIRDECYGLPVAIKALASILSGKKSLDDWIDARDTLKDHSKKLDIEEGMEDHYKCLKLSVDELKDAQEVSLFLLCALFPNDAEITIEVLIRFAFGLGIFFDVDSYRGARYKVREAITKFKNYCLLLQEGHYVKLHDMFHALALWKANNETQEERKKIQVIVMEPGQILAISRSNDAEYTKRLYCHGVEEFPEQLNFPELEILIMFDNGGCSSSKFWAMISKMMKLKVLAIKNTSIGTKPDLVLPQSMEGLKKLRTLCLRGWTLKKNSMFEKLVMIHTLELLDCVMEELPQEFSNMKALKLLEVSNCNIGGNPYKVLATCSHLEELYFVDNDFPEMVQLTDPINVAEFFHQIGSFKVQRYHLGLGGSINTSKDHSSSKLISINYFDSSSITNEAFQALSQELEVLFFEKVQGDCKSIIPDMFPIQARCLNELKEFVLRDSDCIKYLIDTTNHQLDQTRILLAKLQKLKVEAMNFLEALCYGPPPSGLFENLKELFIKDCNKLASLFTTIAAKKLVMLEVLEVIDCDNLRYMIQDENEDEDTSVGSVLTRLKRIGVKRCKSLKCLLPISIASGLSELDTLEMEDAAELKFVFGNDKDERDQKQKQISIDLSSVNIFKLVNLSIINSICPQSYKVELPPFDKIVVTGSPGLSGMFNSNSEVKQQDGDEATEQAEVLSMSSGVDLKFNTLVTYLRKEKDLLVSRLESIAVTEQVEEAGDLIKKVEKLERKVEASKSHCCNGAFPNWMGRYVLHKRVERMTKNVKQFNGRLPVTPHPVSREGLFEEIMEALKDDEIYMIGLHGIDGIGKTTLIKKVGMEVKSSKLFDTVTMVKVSQGGDIKSIQEEIATLSMKLNNVEKILIILDDMWEVLKLEHLGIPLSKNCKVVLTTRYQHLCTMMGCQKMVYLSRLSKQEAFNLFEEEAGKMPDNLKDTALQILEECDGLPLAIVTMAKVLKNKPEDAWEDTLMQLKNIPDEKKVFFVALKYSIDHLVNQEVRSLLFLCALFPEDSNIAVENLIRFAIGLGILKDVDSYSRARTKLGTIVDERINSCFLQQRDEKRQLYGMHDLVREAVLKFTEDIQVFIGPEDNLITMMEKGYMKDRTRLYCRDIKEYPNQLNCPKLEFLFVSNDSGSSSEFSDAFFIKMIVLKVLALMNTSMWTAPNLLLPRSMGRLEMLRTICLRGWTLKNISILRHLKMLDSIELSYCVMKELPKELAELRSLRLLEARGCRIGSNPFEVLARCSNLEELYFVENSLPEIVSEDHHVVKLLHQIGSSKLLRRYHLQIGNSIDTLKNDFVPNFLSINGFNIPSLNEEMKNAAQKPEVLFLENVKGDCKTIFPDVIPIDEECMNTLTEFLLHDSDNIEWFIDTISHPMYAATTVFSRLLKLKVKTMKCFKALCRGRAPINVFEKLEELFIVQCIELHSIVSVGKLNLCNLKNLLLEDCPKLTYVFTYSTAQTMSSLEILKARDCISLKRIIKDEEKVEMTSVRPIFPNLKQVFVKGCPQLEFIIPASCHGGLPKLSIISDSEVAIQQGGGKFTNQELESDIVMQSVEDIHADECKMEGIFQLTEPVIDMESNSLELSCLQYLVMENLPYLRYINEGHKQLLNLRRVRIYKCKELICIFSLHMMTYVSALQELIIEDCCQLEQIIGNDSYNGEYSGTGPFSQNCNLQKIIVKSCPLLGSLFSVSAAKILRLMRTLKIEDCPRMKFLLKDESPEAYESKETVEEDCGQSIFPNLGFLSLENLPELIHFCEKEDFEAVKGVMFPESFNLSNLQSMTVKSCPRLRSLFTVSTAKTLMWLTSLEITDCSRLEYVIKGKNTEIAQGDSEEMLPKLNILHLVMLPSLIMIHRGIKLQCELCHVQDCPKLKQTLAGALQLNELPRNYESPEEDYQECDDMDWTEEKRKEVEYAIRDGNSNVIEQSSTSCEESKDVGNSSVDSLSPAMASGSSEVVSILQDKDVLSHIGLTHSNEDKENQRGNNDIPSGSIGTSSNFHLLKQDGTDVHPHSLEGLKEQNFGLVVPSNLRESNMEIKKLSLHKDPGEESTMGTSSQVLIEKQPQIVLASHQALQEHRVSLPLAGQSAMISSSGTRITITSPNSEAQVSSSNRQHQIAEDEAFVKQTGSYIHTMKQDDTSAPHQAMLPEDSKNERQGASEFQPHSQNSDAVGDYQEQHRYPVGSLNSIENATEIVKGSLQNDPAPVESTVGSSSQGKIELSQVAVDPQQVLGEYKGSLSLPMDPTVLSPNQHPPSEERVDFHGLFKIKERSAHLLEEAFIKYPHLREWKLSQKTPRICKVGYESLADILAFLKSETAKTMNESKMEEFENLYYELEYFGFDKMWLASIHQRVMDMQVDHNNKLKQLDQLEYEIGNLEEQLSDARASLASVKDDLSKPGHVFGF